MARKNCDPKGDVHWRVPGRKRPIAYSTKATSDYIVSLAENGGTIREIQSQVTYSPEAIEVLQKYIDLGYGDVVAREWFPRRF